MRFRPTLPSPAMAVAMTALFVALGGTGYAATQLPGKGDVQSAAKHKKKKPATDAGPDTSLFNKLFAKANDNAQDLAGLNAFLAVTAVPNSKHATAADSATNATNSTNSTNATNATHASSADTATTASAPATLASGHTVIGDWSDGCTNAASTADFCVSVTNYDGFTLPAKPTAHFIGIGATPPAGCPGTAAAPAANPGVLCVYEVAAPVTAPGPPSTFDPETTGGAFGTANTHAFGIEFHPAAAGNSPFIYGTYAVTAP